MIKNEKGNVNHWVGNYDDDKEERERGEEKEKKKKKKESRISFDPE